MITTITRQAIHPLLFVHAFYPRCEKPQPLYSMCCDTYLADERDAER
ncbi:MAG TPA: hypothetical protein VF458_14570 [Ktedonobacteraceae bacterium]